MILLLKDKTSFFQIIFIILAGLTGCKHEDLQNKSEMILSFENVHSQPWVILENEQTVNGLIAMCYQSESNTLFSVDREFGSLVQWDLNTFSVVKVHAWFRITR